MATYTYSLASDFSGNLNHRQLHDEIDESSITQILTSVTSNGDVVNIYFDASLNASGVTTLDNLVSDHIPAQLYNFSKVIVLSPLVQSTYSTIYKKVHVYYYEGSKSIGTITCTNVLSYMSSGVTNYTIRLFDQTNDTVLAENTFTNTEEEECILTPISNVPEKAAILEIQIKKYGGDKTKKVYFDSVRFGII